MAGSETFTQSLRFAHIRYGEMAGLRVVRPSYVYTLCTVCSLLSVWRGRRSQCVYEIEGCGGGNGERYETTMLMRTIFAIFAVALLGAAIAAPIVDEADLFQGTFKEQVYKRSAAYAEDAKEALFNRYESEAPNGPVKTLPGYGPVDELQYAGYVTLNASANSNMFYWFFESQNDPANDPVVVWLQGGPGGSGLVGLFLELGPYKVNSDLTLSKNPYSWNKKANLLFVDNPVGTGFSYTKNYRTNEDQIAQDFHYFLQQFMDRYTKYNNSPIYLFGESYAGKYIPAMAYWMLKLPSIIPFKLAGVGIGDGWTDPYIQNQHYGDFAYSNGLIDQNQFKEVDGYVDDCKAAINDNDYIKAGDVCNNILSAVLNASGDPNVYDIRTYEQYSFAQVGAYLAQPSVRKALYATTHKWGSTSGQVAEALDADIMASQLDKMPYVLNNTRVLIYNGQFDLICNLVGVEAMYDNLAWRGSDEFASADRTIWYNGSKVAGFARQADNLTQLIVLGAGHLAPMNQPANTLDMLLRFTSDSPFN